MTCWLGYCPSAELWLRTQGSQRQPAHATPWHFPLLGPLWLHSPGERQLRLSHLHTHTSGASKEGLAAVVAATFEALGLCVPSTLD